MSSNEQLLDATIADGLRKMAAGVAAGVVAARRTCLTCVHFVEASENCALYNARPPARVIAFGCERHSERPPF